MNTVQSVEIKKQGTNTKTGKAWTMYQVVTEDGQKASGFDLVRVGESIELVQDGKYLNFKKLSGGGGENTQKPVQAAPSSPVHSNGTDIEGTRRHIMQSANLYVLCVNAVNNYVADHLPEVVQTSEQFQAAVGTLFIEASHKRTNDGVNWWSYVDRMPQTPIK